MRYNLDTKSRLFLPDYRHVDSRLSYKNYCTDKVLKYLDLQLFAGDTFNESFEGAGSENSWSETVGEGNTFDDDAGIPGTPPAGSGSQCLQTVQAGTNPQAYATIDFGSNMTIAYFRFYLYADAFDTNDTDILGIFHLADAVENFGVGIRYTATYGRHLYAFAYDSGDNTFVSADEAQINEDTWYRIEGKYDSDADLAEFKVDGVTIDTYVGSGLRVDTDRINIGQCGFSNVGTNANTGANDIYFDLVSIDSSGWIGAESAGGVAPTGAIYGPFGGPLRGPV